MNKENNPDSLKYDRYACAIKRIKQSQGVLIPTLATVGHIPLEISKFCSYFMDHGGEIEGKVVEVRPRRSPIPSGGLEIKLLLTFCSSGPIVDKTETTRKRGLFPLFLGIHGSRARQQRQITTI